MVAGKVLSSRSSGAGSNNAPSGRWPTTASPTNASTMPANTMSAVSAQPAQSGPSRVPGQSSQQKAIIDTTGRAKVISGARISSDGSAPPAPIASSTATGSTVSRPASPRPG